MPKSTPTIVKCITKSTITTDPLAFTARKQSGCRHGVGRSFQVSGITGCRPLAGRVPGRAPRNMRGHGQSGRSLSRNHVLVSRRIDQRHESLFLRCGSGLGQVHSLSRRVDRAAFLGRSLCRQRWPERPQKPDGMVLHPPTRDPSVGHGKGADRQ